MLDEIVAIQRGVVNKLIKKIGSNLFSGKSVMSISFPVCVFSHYSMLQRCASDARFIIELIESWKNETTKIRQFGVVLGMLAGFQN